MRFLVQEFFYFFLNSSKTIDNTTKKAYNIITKIRGDIAMEIKDLSGYQICHVSDNMAGVLREKRVTLGLTQKQVAEKAKITLREYQRFESGERNIMTSAFRTSCRIIEALGMNVSDFFHGEYVFGEKVEMSEKGLRYAKTGKLIEEDVEKSKK